MPGAADPCAGERYTVAVRALCEFTAKAGDLDLRFTPAPTAQQGIAGHAAVAARRKPPYEAEISLSGAYRELTVRGRADGFDPAANRLEEVKTYRGELDAMPANHRHLHWAQLRIYGWLLCQARGLEALTLSLVYYDIGSQRETHISESRDAAWLRAHFETHCERFLAWARQELAHRAQRDAALTALAFPHAAFRPGQRQLAAAVYRAARDGLCLAAQAPTGIGKTVGTLFPLLKAAPAAGIDKIFFLAAKTSGRKLAFDAIAQLDAAGELPLRRLELVARDKACVHPELACHGDSCPLARGFYDRLPAARAAALDAGALMREALAALAQAHQVCPYYLGQEMARWADVTVGDYNYYFDTSAQLFALAQGNDWRAALLVDEAHNLIERARGMYSAELSQAALRALRRAAPSAVKPALDKLNRQWNALLRTATEPYQVLEAAPDGLLSALQQASTAITDHLAEQPQQPELELQRFLFDALHFCRIAESFGPHSLFDLSRGPGAKESRLCLRNIVPAPHLAPRLAAAHAVTLFSATLNPRAYVADMLGLPPSAAWLDVESPFDADQLAVRVVPGISTRWRERDASLAPIAELIARQYRRQPGNYLVFCSSFDYLGKIADAFVERDPAIPCWRQERGMEEAARAAFLERFTEDGSGIGFAVLGGAFGEGIDLPGRRLIGAFIATLGLPQVNPVNEQFRQRMDAAFGSGYDYAYLYPGLQKVVQAAGRVIRSRSDRGVLYLIDERYARGQVRRLLPQWWRIAAAGNSHAPD
jgi:Rad3-related DNA helicase